jgi:hypothetical protein
MKIYLKKRKGIVSDYGKKCQPIQRGKKQFLQTMQKTEKKRTDAKKQFSCKPDGRKELTGGNMT